MTDKSKLATEEGYVSFVIGLASPPESLRFDQATNLLVDELKALAGPGLILDHLKRNIAYGDKLRMNNTAVSEVATPLNPDMGNYGAKADMAHAMLGIITEAIELAPVLIALLKGEDIDLVNLIEELGDGVFYTQLAAMATVHLLGLRGGDVPSTEESMKFVRKVNVDKLYDRYKGLQFQADKAITRDIDAEQKVMEDSIANK